MYSRRGWETEAKVPRALRWKAGGQWAQGHMRSGAGGASRCRESVGMQKVLDPLRVLLSGEQALGSRCEQVRLGLRGAVKVVRSYQILQSDVG